MDHNSSKVKDFFKKNIIPFLLLVYFGRFAIPQGSFHAFSPTWFFYSFTLLFVLGYLVIIGIIGIVGWAKSRKNSIPVESKHKSFLILSVFGLVLFGLSMTSRYAYDHKKFDSVLWRDKQASLDWDSNLLTPRQRMTNDLVTAVLPGLRSNQIESLLDSPYQSWQPEEGGTNFLYVLGPERGLGVDYECLLIHFDEMDNYQSYKTFGNCG